MPPKKRNCRTVKVGLGRVELLVLEHLVAVSGGSLAEHIRNAIRYYAKQSGAIDRSWLDAQVNELLSDPAEQLELTAAVRRLCDEGDCVLPGRLPINLGDLELSHSRFREAV